MDGPEPERYAGVGGARLPWSQIASVALSRFHFLRSFKRTFVVGYEVAQQDVTPTWKPGEFFRVSSLYSALQLHKLEVARLSNSIPATGQSIPSGRLTGVLSGFNGGISPVKSASLQRLVGHCWRVYREQSVNPEALLSLSHRLIPLAPAVRAGVRMSV